MMPRSVYAKLYRLARRQPEGDVLEIGAGRGAGTLALALGLKHAKKRSKVVAVERFAGGSNVDFGSKDENLVRIRTLLRRYGVEEKVTLFPAFLCEDNLDQLTRLLESELLGLLVIDADGRLDFYLPALWSRLSVNTPIVLDDYRESYHFGHKSERHPLGRTKQLTCFRLVNRLVALGFLEIDLVKRDTVFARKATSAPFQPADIETLRREVASVQHDYEQWLARQATDRGRAAA